MSSWTRGAEWGSTVLLLAVVGLIVLTTFYFTFSVDHLGASFLFLLIGGAIWVVLTYPIVITMERPIRMTPEQAVKDYFAALSHHFPHYRRMWLLLSTPGKESREFGSFAGFRAYWKGRLSRLRGGRVKGTTPLAFEIADFKSDKSAGQTSVEASFTVIVRPRGESTEPLESVRVTTTLARGSDNMWYLNSGELPGRV